MILTFRTLYIIVMNVKKRVLFGIICFIVLAASVVGVVATDNGPTARDGFATKLNASVADKPWYAPIVDIWNTVSEKVVSFFKETFETVKEKTLSFFAETFETVKEYAVKYWDIAMKWAEETLPFPWWVLPIIAVGVILLTVVLVKVFKPKTLVTYTSKKGFDVIQKRGGKTYVRRPPNA